MSLLYKFNKLIFKIINNYNNTCFIVFSNKRLKQNKPLMNQKILLETYKIRAFKAHDILV